MYEYSFVCDYAHFILDHVVYMCWVFLSVAKCVIVFAFAAQCFKAANIEFHIIYCPFVGKMQSMSETHTEWRSLSTFTTAPTEMNKKHLNHFHIGFILVVRLRFIERRRCTRWKLNLARFHNLTNTRLISIIESLLNGIEIFVPCFIISLL